MELDKNTTALLVIDAIESVGDDSLYDPDAATAAYRAAVARSVAACHAAGIPVIYCNDAHIRGLDRELDLWGEHGVAGEVRVFPEIEQTPGDITIPKRRYSGFFQTDLDLTLRELGVKTEYEGLPLPLIMDGRAQPNNLKQAGVDEAWLTALLARRGWQMPVVLTHTCPLRYKPLEALKPDLDQSTVDCTTELWMDAIESRLRYDHWFCGHFHTDKQIDNLQILFQTFVPFPSEG